MNIPRGQKQSAYQVLVASSEALLKQDKGDLWDSKKVASDQSIQVEYAGKALEARTYCHWKVRVWLAANGIEASKQGKTDQGSASYTTFNQQLEFTSAGKPGEQIWPKHNDFSYRYAIVEGLPAAPAPGDAEAMMIESNLESAGTFECSNDLFNRINQVNLWTIRCLNLGGYMVDCPHRERMGYGGDGQTSIDTQIMNLDASAFYTKWTTEGLDDQNPVTGKSAQYSPNGANADGSPDANCWFLWGGMVDVLLVAGVIPGWAAPAKVDDPAGVLKKPIPDKLVILTFDDGPVSGYSYCAPILKSHGFGGSFYVCDFDSFKTRKDWYMTFRQMKAMDEEGLEIGNHSAGHFSGYQAMLNMEDELLAHHVPKPNTIAWPLGGAAMSDVPAFVSSGYLFARGGYSRPYRPTVDNGFDIPSAGCYNMADFVKTASLLLSVGGPGEFTGAQVGTLLKNLTTSVNHNGMMEGSYISLDLSNAKDPVIVSADIANSKGPGGGPMFIKKSGAGTLQLSGKNTFTGQTFLEAGPLSVASLNSVVKGKASSSLGAPTDIEAGEIVIGVEGKDGECTLIYTGTGETTDRVMNLAGKDFTITFDQSGKGTWALSGTNTYTGPTIVKQGTLSLGGNHCLSDKTEVSLSEGAMLDLNFKGEMRVSKLSLDGKLQPAGTYSAKTAPQSIKGQGVLKNQG